MYARLVKVVTTLTLERANALTRCVLHDADCAALPFAIGVTFTRVTRFRGATREGFKLRARQTGGRHSLLRLNSHLSLAHFCHRLQALETIVEIKYASLEPNLTLAHFAHVTIVLSLPRGARRGASTPPLPRHYFARKGSSTRRKEFSDGYIPVL